MGFSEVRRKERVRQQVRVLCLLSVKEQMGQIVCEYLGFSIPAFSIPAFQHMNEQTAMIFAFASRHAR